MRIKWHYKDSLFLMLIGFLVAFAAFVDVGYMIFQNQTYSELSSRYTYDNSTLLDASDEQGIDFEAFATKKGNLSISSMTTMLDEGQQHYMLTIAMKQNEPYQYQLLEGTVEEPDDTSVPVAVIGKSLKPYTFMRKGQRYIMLEGDAYKVIGITGNAYCEYNDSELLVFYHTLGKNLKRSLQSQTTVQFRLQSNECDTYEEAMQLYETVTRKQPSLNCSLTALENVTYDQGMDDFRSIVDILLFLFCLINCVVVSIYWMQKRRREIAVRRLYGYTVVQIAVMMWKELLRVMAAAAILLVLFHVVLQGIVVRQLPDFSLYYLIRSGILFVLFSLITSAITIFYPLYHVQKTPLAVAVYEEE